MFSVHPQLPPIQHRPHCYWLTDWLTGHRHGELLPRGSNNRLEWLCARSEMLRHAHWKHLLLMCFCLCLTVNPNATQKQRLVRGFKPATTIAEELSCKHNAGRYGTTWEVMCGLVFWPDECKSIPPTYNSWLLVAANSSGKYLALKRINPQLCSPASCYLGLVMVVAKWHETWRWQEWTETVKNVDHKTKTMSWQTVFSGGGGQSRGIVLSWIYRICPKSLTTLYI